MTCHYNPFGAGPLNDYGRAVSASVIADRLFISKNVTDEDLGESSGFLFNTPKQTFFRPSIDYRGMQLKRGIDQDDPDDKYINMQIDVNVVLKFGEKDKYIASFTHGIVPDNSARPIKGEVEELNYTREAYIGYRPTQSLGFYVGKMDKIFGLRVPDHNAYSKVAGNLTQYSSAAGFMFHLGGEKFDFGAQVFDSDGDIEKKEGEQTNGYTGKFEYSIFEDFRLGLSYLAESDKNENTKTMYATTIKSRVGKGSSVMLEVGRIVNDIKASGEITSNYIFLQNHMKLARGLNFLFTYQYYQADTDKESEVFTFAPGIQYYPWQRVETRAEIQNTRSVDDDENTPVAQDSWTFLGQVHLWF